MMRRTTFLAVLLMAAGCQQDHSPRPSGSSSSDAPAQWSYACADGSKVKASYPTNDSARLQIGDQTIHMKIAISASGARYTGGGWQWWTKGDQAWLAPLAPGEEIASATGMSCTGRPAN